MKYKIILLLVAFLFFASGQKVCAQQVIVPAGHVKIVITPVGKQPRTYQFLDKLGYSYNCIQSDDENPKLRSTRFMCGGAFRNADNTETSLEINFNIGPSGVGTFYLNADEGKPYGNIIVGFNDVDGPNLMAFPHNGTYGTITITNYPSPGGNLTGTFKARLHDESDKKSGFYDVSGEFSVRRVE